MSSWDQMGTDEDNSLRPEKSLFRLRQLVIAELYDLDLLTITPNEFIDLLGELEKYIIIKYLGGYFGDLDWYRQLILELINKIDPKLIADFKFEGEDYHKLLSSLEGLSELEPPISFICFKPEDYWNDDDLDRASSGFDQYATTLVKSKYNKAMTDISSSAQENSSYEDSQQYRIIKELQSAIWGMKNLSKEELAELERLAKECNVSDFVGSYRQIVDNIFGNISSDIIPMVTIPEAIINFEYLLRDYVYHELIKSFEARIKIEDSINFDKVKTAIKIIILLEEVYHEYRPVS